MQKTSDEITELLENKKTLNANIDYQKKVLAVINEVKEKGTKADVSSITDEELLTYLNALAQSVDSFDKPHAQYANANIKYVRLLAVYEEAKKDEAQAQKVYDDTMKALDAYIQETSKHAAKTENASSPTKNNATTSSSTNTGVKTQAGLNMAMMGVAALGIVEAKRRSKKQQFIIARESLELYFFVELYFHSFYNKYITTERKYYLCFVKIVGTN